ncbi:MAG: HEAT repeat domain-containing protein [Nitrospirae bacterium]|nr:MAG: HEAT repeat domain-containing protein [Nitrospirota bacterium]
MAYNSFEEVYRLSVEKEREILKYGDCVEKIWAAWSIGLKLGKDAVPDLIACLYECPTPGTRRHIIVILAGFGQYDVVKEFAYNDPDEYVRLTAREYLERIKHWKQH